jgi:hypothetical protein
MMHVKNVALLCGGIVAAVSACVILLSAAEVHYVYFDRHNLPDLGPFTRFEFSTVGHIYDARDAANRAGPRAARDLALRGHSIDRP